MKQRFQLFGNELAELMERTPAGTVISATLPAHYLTLDLSTDNDRVVGETLVEIRRDRKFKKTCETLEAAYAVLDAVA